MTYSEKLKDPRWQKKRLEVLTRDEWRCRSCGCEDKTLHVHHHHYTRGQPWDTPIELLSALCDECHEKRHGLEKEAKLILAEMLANISSCPWEKDDDSSLDRFVKSSRAALEKIKMGECEIYTHDDLCDAHQVGYKSGLQASK